MAREGVPLNVIQRHLKHANLGITPVYLQGIDNAEISEEGRSVARRLGLLYSWEPAPTATMHAS